jgi:hypothetical protein
LNPLYRTPVGFGPGLLDYLLLQLADQQSALVTAQIYD